MTPEEEQRFRFSAIAHADLPVMNPLSDAALDEAIDALQLAPGARALDLGCGKAEVLRRVVERYEAHGVGVELSPFLLRQARADAMRLERGSLELVEGDALTYVADPPFDLVMAIGPGWEHSSFGGLLQQMHRHVVERGLLLVADGYWRVEPTDDYLRHLGATRDEMQAHADNVRTGIGLGLEPLWATTATEQDWDRYEWRWLAAVERWAASHPRDPQRAVFLERARAGRDRYLAGGREQLGFGIYLFRATG
jgi:SAM-dependent methyltransferase